MESKKIPSHFAAGQNSGHCFIQSGLGFGGGQLLATVRLMRNKESPLFRKGGFFSI